MPNDSFIQDGCAVIKLEADALQTLARRTADEFSEACKLILKCNGRVIVVGMGKSGHIGGKIAATLASTGTPAFFVHPGEASHGDLGMITQTDLVIAISNSGETPEVLTILPVIKRMGVQSIALTGNPKSTLAQQANVTINVGVEKEACPLNLAPTASTTATLAMGDALAVALYQFRGFTEQDFARSHPGGALGKRLLLYVEDIMHRDNAIPLVANNALLADALLEMTSKGLGMTGVSDKDGHLLGIYTDGDLRRSLSESADPKKTNITEVMTCDPVTVKPSTLAAEVVQLMHTKSINGIFVVNDNHQIVGALNMHDLLRAGIV